MSSVPGYDITIDMVIIDNAREGPVGKEWWFILAPDYRTLVKSQLNFSIAQDKAASNTVFFDNDTSPTTQYPSLDIWKIPVPPGWTLGASAATKVLILRTSDPFIVFKMLTGGG